MNILNKVMSIHVGLHACVTAASFLVLGFVNTKLDQFYAASKHPVAYAVGQTSFDGEQIKSYYAHMLAEGSLGIYWQTQFFDFAFIASVTVFGLLLGSLLLRMSAENRVLKLLAFCVLLGMPLGACFDVVENLISFVMLSNPLDFTNWIAIPYSLAACIKFALIALGLFATFGWVLCKFGFLVAKLVRRVTH